MESTRIEPTDTLNSNGDTSAQQSTRCFVAWTAIGLVLITWLCLFLALSFFWIKNKDIFSRNTTQLTQIETQLSQNQSKYQELQKNLIQTQNLIQKKFTANDTSLQLNEIAQLIQLAHYNLLYLHDKSSALSALNSADKQLIDLVNFPVSLEGLKNLLAQNIANLNALPTIDLSDILAKLNTLQVQVTQLPLISSMPTSNKETTTSANAQTNTEKKWFNAIQASLRSFQQLIVIRHLDKPIEPLLPQEQQQYLQHNLQLLLQQAQWALLHQQQTIYLASLQQVKEAIQQHFAENSLISQTIIQSLNELEKINLKPTLPDLMPTLQAVNSINQAMSNQAPIAQKEIPL